MFVDTPTGELFIFNNEDDVKDFFIMLSLDPEDMESVGVTIHHTGSEEDDNFEYAFEEIENARIYPIFEENMFIPDDQKHSFTGKRIVYTRDILSLCPVMYSSFPLVAYVNIQKMWDRTGNTELFIFQISPITELLTVESVKTIVEKNKKCWDDNLAFRLECERRHDIG